MQGCDERPPSCAAARAYDAVDLTGPVALVLGSEAHGLPAALDALVDDRLTIPMAGRSESLNVAMAGSVLCFESLRQRRAAGDDRHPDRRAARRRAGGRRRRHPAGR